MRNQTQITRREFFRASVALLGATALYGSPFPVFASTGEGKFEITKTEAEWRQILTPGQYEILREEETENAYSSPLNDEKRKGVYHCAGCDLAAYESSTKYDSGTGWPSFWDSIENAIGTKEDNGFFSTRTEVHCRRCGGHFGHIFDDGPAPTGKRHCLNGLALKFYPVTG